jgi:hypothetical protein
MRDYTVWAKFGASDVEAPTCIITTDLEKGENQWKQFSGFSERKEFQYIAYTYVKRM